MGEPALALARESFERGQYLEAWRIARPLGPIRSWSGAEALVFAGRLANQLGDGHLGDRFFLRAHRLHPGSGDAWLRVIGVVWTRHGPWAARALALRGAPEQTSPEELLALQARIAADLRDFDEAERLLAEALAAAPDDAWTLLQRAIVQAEADDHAAALEGTDRALSLRPWFRPAVDFRARTLVHLGREDEAIRFLEEAIGRNEAASTCVELLQLQLERGEHAAAEATLARISERTPLRNRAYEDWLESRRSDVACHRGDYPRAAEHARRSRVPFYQALAERLEAPRSTRRVVLPVPFVRQHAMTCAPATLSAICAFHGLEADHLGIAEAICYDGTPDHAERGWARARGFEVREFRVTWDSAVALLERGLPFTLTMVAPANAHLVAATGFDEARGVLLLRDPSSRPIVEITRGWLEEHASSGPRGMVMAPPGAAARLDGLELPDAPLYDLYHRAQAALVEHERPAAVAAAAELTAAAPGHLLVLQLERSLARYDGSRERELAAVDALLATYPDDVNFRLSRQAALGALGRRKERIDWLRGEGARRPHPLLSQALGEALQHDARDLGESELLARALVRRLPYDGLAYHLLGDALWARGARDEATLAYRFAACLERTNDHFAEAYFRACRHLGRAEEALRFLRGRFERFGGKSHLPGVTLADALDAIEASAEQLAVLERAIARRPDDGALLLHAARAFAIAGQRARGAELLERARGTAHAAEVLRTVALIEELEGNLTAAAGARERVAALEPLDVGAAEEAARLLAETRDRGAAIAFLRRSVERFPHHQGLGRALIGWMDREPPEEVETELRRFVAAVPGDAWGHRELALHLSRSGRADEALAELEVAAQIEPDAPSSFNVRATVKRRMGRLDEAREALRESLRRSVDQEWTIDELMELAPEGAARVEVLGFLRRELERQVTFGDAMLAWQRLGVGVLPAEELLGSLRAAHAARPDLWHAWVALGRQLVQMDRTEEARAHLEAATRRFPLLPRGWFELGLVHRAQGDDAGWRRMLERALELSPGWRDATFKLAEALQAAGEFEAARSVLARALRHAPSDGYLHGWLADALCGLDREGEAIEELQRALRLEPGYSWALWRLEDLCRGTERARLPEELAEELVRERPGEARAWLLAARVRRGTAERLEAVGRALALEPTWIEAVRLRMEVLADAGRTDDAIAAVEAPPWNGPPPRSLRLEAARIGHRCGRTGGARVALDALLEAEPDFFDAWEQAAEWHDAAGRHADCLVAARQLVRLAPHRASSVGWLALALLADGDRAGGKEALIRAVRLDPANRWAVGRLFRLRLDDRELDQAAELLPLFGHHFDDGELPRRRLQLEVARKDRAAARAAFAALVAAGDRGGAVAGVEELLAAGWGDDAGEALATALDGDTAPAAAGAAWHRWASDALTHRRLDARLRGAMARAERPGPALAAAVQIQLERLAEANQRWSVRRWVWRHGSKLDANVKLWGTTGYALTTQRAYRGAIRWMSGWRAREGREPWMLLNLSLALVHRGRLAEASAASADALRLDPDATRARHLAVVAAEAALRGEVGPEVPFPPEGEDLRGAFAWLAAVARALRGALSAPDSRTGWRRAAPRLSEAALARPLLGDTGAFLRLWLRVLKVLALHLGRGGPLTAWWYARALLRVVVPR